MNLLTGMRFIIDDIKINIRGFVGDFAVARCQSQAKDIGVIEIEEGYFCNMFPKTLEQ